MPDTRLNRARRLGSESYFDYTIMPLANWSASRLVTIWLIGLGVEATILTAQWFTSADVRADMRRVEAHFDSVAMRMDTTTPRQGARSDSLRAKFIATAESLGIKVEKHGDTTVVRMPPEMERRWDAFFESMGRSIDQAVMIAALELFLIPSVLTLLTVVWLIQRRRMRMAAHHDSP